MKKILGLLAATALFGTAAIAEPVKVGMVTTLSTGGGYLGDHVAKGFKLAMQHAGVEDKIELLVEDDGRKPNNAIDITQRMVEKDGVKIMTGVIFSNIAMATVPKLIRTNDIVYVSPNAGPSALAGKGCHPRYFNAAWQNDNLAEVVGQHVKDQGFKNVYVMAPNYPAGKDSVEGFKRFYGGAIAGEAFTKLGQSDYAAEIANLRAAKPDALYFFYPGGMGINFMKQFAAAGLTDSISAFGPAFSFDELLLDAVGEAATGIVNGAQWSPDLDTDINKKFVADFKAAYEKDPTVYASQGYDTGNLIISALQAVDWSTDDMDAVAAAIKAADFKAVRGSFKFGNNNHPIQDIYVRKVTNVDGNMTNRLVGKVFENHQDAYAASCAM